MDISMRIVLRLTHGSRKDFLYLNVEKDGDQILTLENAKPSSAIDALAHTLKSVLVG